MNEWEVIRTDQFERDLKRMTKRYPRETAQMLINLEEYKQNLCAKDNPLLLVQSSYVHRETSGCHAITQQPLASAAQTRLYAYAYILGRELHLICAGDKQSQSKDNSYCKQYISQF